MPQHGLRCSLCTRKVSERLVVYKHNHGTFLDIAKKLYFYLRPNHWVEFSETMRARLFRIWLRLKSIPSTLKAITILCWLFGPLLLIPLVTPIEKDEAGDPVSLQEVWSQGYGIVTIGHAFGMLALGTLIYKGWGWVRHALFFGIVAIGLSGFIDPEYKDVPPIVLFGVATIAIFVGYRYFYHNQEVVSYFTGS